MLCIATMKSMTYAIKAQRILTNRNIPSEIVSLDSTLTKNGCSYGIKFNCDNKNTVEEFLHANGIIYGEIIGSNRYGSEISM